MKMCVERAPHFPRDCAEFKGCNERSSDWRPQTSEKQQPEADGNDAYGDYLGGGLVRYEGGSPLNLPPHCKPSSAFRPRAAHCLPVIATFC